ncbi:hypothetical protein ACFL1N_02480 [Thermodesulfobacteriota bacterium]
MSKRNWKNPIFEGQRYLEYWDSNPDFKYKDVADEFGVSKARVSQMVAIVKKLPEKIIDCFLRGDLSDEIRYFTERKLRPLTLLDSDDMKIKKILQMLKNQPESLRNRFTRK